MAGTTVTCRRHQREAKQWVQQGGVVIGQRGGAEWLSNSGLHARYVDSDVFKNAFKRDGLTYQNVMTSTQSNVLPALSSQWT